MEGFMALGKLELMGEIEVKSIFKILLLKKKLKCGFKLQPKQKIITRDFVASCMKRSSVLKKMKS